LKQRRLPLKRRDLLKSAAFVLPAAGFPAAGFEAFALGQSAALPPTGGIHPVEAGQDRFGETHSLGYPVLCVVESIDSAVRTRMRVPAGTVMFFGFC
jgi:hypothetical protein